MNKDNLTSRQIQLLKVIIEEYINTALPVGSETIDKKYNLGVSPATIRNEMVNLTNKGYLKQLYTSSGRSPTPKALKYYVDNLLKQKELTVADEVAVKEKVWGYRHELDKLLKETTSIISQRTKALSLATTEDGDLYYCGASYLLDIPEFLDLTLAKRLFALLDEYNYWKKLFFDIDTGNEFQVIVGNELGEQLEPCGLVYSRFRIPGHGQGTIGVIGSNRLDYGYIIPVVRYMANLLSEIATF